MSKRVVIKAQLEPVAGSAFQPTGFPDLGPARFERPDGSGEVTSCLLVESAQSMTNHLEGLGWDKSVNKPQQFMQKLPYVEVVNGEGTFLSSSRLEPHRVASPYVSDAKIADVGGNDWLISRLNLAKGKPINWQELYRSVFQIDPFCLIHGIFLSNKKMSEYGNPKIRRAITATVEAHDVHEVVSGGVKRDDVNPTQSEGRGSADLYGFIPFGRVEFTARSIQLNAVIDLEQIHGYGLDQDQTQLLEDLAQWELAKLLSSPLRLRTACDLECTGEIQVRGGQGNSLLAVDELEQRITNSSVVFENPGATVAVWNEPVAKGKNKSSDEA